MKIVLTPQWFLGKDVIIDIISFLVLIAFFILCYKNYRLDKKKNVMVLGFGFLLIALAQLSAIFTKLILYDFFSFSQEVGQMIITYNVVKSVDIFYYIGFFFHKLLTLAGLYIIYRLPRKKLSLGDYFLTIYILIISALLGVKYEMIFHVTSLIILFLITGNYYEIYKKNKNRNTIILFIAFGILTLAHAIYIAPSAPNLYVSANLLELVSYLMLVFLMIRIFYHGKEKKQNEYSVRYAGNDNRKRR